MRKPVPAIRDVVTARHVPRWRVGQEKCCVRPLASEGFAFEEVDGGRGCFESAELHVERKVFVRVPFHRPCPEKIARFLPNAHNHAALRGTAGRPVLGRALPRALPPDLNPEAPRPCLRPGRRGEPLIVPPMQVSTACLLPLVRWGKIGTSRNKKEVNL